MKRSLLSFALAAACLAQPAYQPSAANLEAREWFQDARFGLFVHWGVYSVPGEGEWVMNNKKIPILAIPSLGDATNARLLDGGAKVEVERVRGGLLLHLPRRDPAGTVIVLDKIL